MPKRGYKRECARWIEGLFTDEFSKVSGQAARRFRGQVRLRKEVGGDVL